MTEQKRPALIHVDCEGTLWPSGDEAEVNWGLLTALDSAAEAEHIIILFTGGDSAKYRRWLVSLTKQLPRSFAKNGWRGGLPPIEDKKDFHGRTLLRCHRRQDARKIG